RDMIAPVEDQNLILEVDLHPQAATVGDQCLGRPRAGQRPLHRRTHGIPRVQALRVLERPDGLKGVGAEPAVHPAWVIPQRREPPWQQPDRPPPHPRAEGRAAAVQTPPTAGTRQARMPPPGTAWLAERPGRTRLTAGNRQGPAPGLAPQRSRGAASNPPRGAKLSDAQRLPDRAPSPRSRPGPPGTAAATSPRRTLLAKGSATIRSVPVLCCSEGSVACCAGEPAG